MKSKPFKILCAHCRTHLYWFHGRFVGPTRPELFEPVAGAVRPGVRVSALCHRCGQRWYMLRENGSLVVMTDQGWKPSAPKGPRHVIANLFPEMSLEDKAGSEYRDLAEIKRNAASHR